MKISLLLSLSSIGNPTVIIPLEVQLFYGKKVKNWRYTPIHHPKK